MSLDTESGGDYIVEKRGANSCTQGSSILDTSECEIACDHLNLKRGALKDGKPCYMAGNGKCRQNARPGRKASLICKNSGYKKLLFIREHLIPSKLSSEMFFLNF